MVELWDKIGLTTLLEWRNSVTVTVSQYNYMRFVRTREEGNDKFPTTLGHHDTVRNMETVSRSRNFHQTSQIQSGAVHDYESTWLDAAVPAEKHCHSTMIGLSVMNADTTFVKLALCHFAKLAALRMKSSLA